MKEKNIKLSPKHGVNPSLILCAICGKSTGLALQGLLKNDAEAPRQVIDREPCDDCKKEIKKYEKIGFTVFVVSPEYEKFQDKATPWQFFQYLHVIKFETAKNIFPEEVLNKKACFINTETALKIGLDNKKND